MTRAYEMSTTVHTSPVSTPLSEDLARVPIPAEPLSSDDNPTMSPDVCVCVSQLPAAVPRLAVAGDTEIEAVCEDIDALLQARERGEETRGKTKKKGKRPAEPYVGRQLHPFLVLALPSVALPFPCRSVAPLSPSVALSLSFRCHWYGSLVRFLPRRVTRRRHIHTTLANGVALATARPAVPSNDTKHPCDCCKALRQRVLYIHADSE